MASTAIDKPMSKLNLGFGESSHVYFVQSTMLRQDLSGGSLMPVKEQAQSSFSALGAVLAENMGHW